MVDYHDKVLLDYIKFGFPLGIAHRSHIISNATENHASAKAYPDEVSSFIQDELAFDVILGPFQQQPHPVGKLTSFRHQNDNGPDVNKLSFFDLV